MNFSDKLLGKKSETVNTAQAIQRLRETEEMLIKKQQYLESKINNELSIAKRNALKNKPMAIQALKRKKRYEKQLQQIDNTLTTIEVQKEALEVANTNVSVLKSMKIASETLKKNHFNVNIDNINNILDDIADQNDLVNEIANAIGNPIIFNETVDEDELMKELEDLEDEAIDEKLFEVPNMKLPDVPETSAASTSKIKVEDSDEDMKQLQQWAS